MTSETFGLNEAYKRVQKVGDHLSEFELLIEWEAFHPIFQDIYHNKTSKGGRPNIDPIVIIKLLVLQSLYNLSNSELERQVTDRVSFRKFIGFTTQIPDFSTVWFFWDTTGLEEMQKAKKGDGIESAHCKGEIGGIGAGRIRSAGYPDLVIRPDGSGSRDRHIIPP